MANPIVSNKNETVLNEKPEFFTKTDIKTRGWNDKLIAKLLSEPDEKRINPNYRSGPLMSLYKKERVFAAEADPFFVKHMEGRTKRQASAKKAVVTKIKQVTDYINSLHISVSRYDRDDLERLALRHYNDLMASRGKDWYSDGSNEEFINRISVNFLRHECTSYEIELDNIFGKTGKEDGYCLLKSIVLDKISASHPWLEDECLRQELKTYERLL